MKSANEDIIWIESNSNFHKYSCTYIKLWNPAVRKASYFLFWFVGSWTYFSSILQLDLSFSILHFYAFTYFLQRTHVSCAQPFYPNKYVVRSLLSCTYTVFIGIKIMVSEMLYHSSGEKFQALFNLYEHSIVNKKKKKNMGEKKILLRKTKMNWHFQCTVIF